MEILLTNDDSHRSPLFRLTIELLRQFGSLSIVVPHHEQSWTSKSMTRFGSVSAHPIDLFGYSAFAVTGTPADCVNIAINSLLPRRPDVVVSGINAGLNCGIGFLLSSGTVGAAIEANLSGVPSIAISQAFDSPTMNSYAADYSMDSAVLDRFEKQYGTALTEVLTFSFSSLLSKLAQQKSMLNINMPFLLKEDWKACVTDVDHTVYGEVFRAVEAKDDTIESRTFRHSVHQVVKEGIKSGDIATISRGDVSVTPLNPWMIGRLEKFGRTEWEALIDEMKKGLPKACV